MAEKSIQMLKTQPTYAIDVLGLVKNEAPSFDFSNLLSSADPDVIVESFECVGIEPSFILDDNEKKTFCPMYGDREWFPVSFSVILFYILVKNPSFAKDRLTT